MLPSDKILEPVINKRLIRKKFFVKEKTTSSQKIKGRKYRVLKSKTLGQTKKI